MAITVFGCPVNRDYLETLLKTAGYDPADESGVVKIVATDDGKITAHWPDGTTSELVGATAGGTDEKVKTSSTDGIAGYLGEKVSGSLTVDTASQTVQLEGDSTSPGNNKYYGTDGSGTKGFFTLPTSSAGASTFTGLTDTPGTYSGAGSKTVKVKSDESGLEFVASTDTDEKVKASSADSTAGYLADKVDGTTIEVSSEKLAVKSGVFASAGHTHEFVDLSDTPSTLSGAGSEFVQVLADESGLSFVTITASDVDGLDTAISNNSDVAANTSARHNQNTDTGTSASEFYVDTGGDNVAVKAHIQTTSGNPHQVTKSDIGLGNVTNDAQLKRSANDWTGFTEKTAAASDDLLLIEDSVDSGAKKKLKVSALPSGSGGSTAGTFVELSDTPANYTGYGGEFVKVKSTEDGLEFGFASTGSTDFVSLSDTPSTYSGQASKSVFVKDDESGLEFDAIEDIYEPKYTVVRQKTSASFTTCSYVSGSITAREWAATAYIGMSGSNTIFHVIGGSTEHDKASAATSDHYRVSITNTGGITVTTLASLPGKRWKGTACYLPDGTIHYVAGSSDTTAGLRTHYVYDISSDSWSTAEQCPYHYSSYNPGTFVDSNGIMWFHAGSEPYLHYWDNDLQRWITRSHITINPYLIISRGIEDKYGRQHWKGYNERHYIWTPWEDKWELYSYPSHLEFCAWGIASDDCLYSFVDGAIYKWNDENGTFDNTGMSCADRQYLEVFSNDSGQVFLLFGYDVTASACTNDIRWFTCEQETSVKATPELVTATSTDVSDLGSIILLSDGPDGFYGHAGELACVNSKGDQITFRPFADFGIRQLKDDHTPELANTLDCKDNSVVFSLQEYTGTGGTTTIDWNNGNHAKFTFGSGDETLAFTAPYNSKACGLTLEVVQDSTGGRSITWPSSVVWTEGEPDLSNDGAGVVRIINFFFDGSKYYGWQHSVDSFTDLSDTPSTLSGAGSKVVTVKSDESGLEFVSKNSIFDPTQWMARKTLSSSTTTSAGWTSLSVGLTTARRALVAVCVPNTGSSTDWYVLGGMASAVVTDNELISLAPDGTITRTAKADMLTAARSGQACYYSADGTVRHIAGYDTSQHQVYDPDANSWTTDTAFPSNLYGGACFTHGDRIYICFGQDSATQRFIKYWSSGATSWTSGTDSSGSTKNYVAYAKDATGLFHVMGGYSGTQQYSHDVYDPDSDTWTMKAGIPTASHAKCAGTDPDGKIHLCAGYDGSNYLTEHKVWTSASNTWSSETDIPSPARGYVNPNGTDDQCRIWLFGGYDRSNNLNDIDYFTVSSDSTTTYECYEIVAKNTAGCTSFG